MNQPSHSYGLAGTNDHESCRASVSDASEGGPVGYSLGEDGFTLAKQRDPESIRGFTLVELLIATGITVAMVLMLGWMLGSLMGSASHATQRVDAFRDARAALQMMERDLRNLVRTQWQLDASGTLRPVTLLAAYFVVDN